MAACVGQQHSSRGMGEDVGEDVNGEMKRHGGSSTSDMKEVPRKVRGDVQRETKKEVWERRWRRMTSICYRGGGLWVNSPGPEIWHKDKIKGLPE